jgi:elongation factor P
MPETRTVSTDMDTSDIKKGLKMMWEGNPYVVVDFQFVKPGKGQAFTRTKMKHLLTGSVIEPNIRSNTKFEQADAEELTLQFIYVDGENSVFMNPTTGEQVSVHKDAVGDAADYLIDGIDCQIAFYKGNPVSVTPPPHITVEVVETEPGAKGDTATNVSKPAKISSGATVGVPLFISEGEWIKVDTRTGDYLERTKAP